MDKRTVERGMRNLEQGKPVVKDPAEERGHGRMGRAIPVKNKAPAPVQITAEQLLREAHDFKEAVNVTPTQKIGSEEELDEYRLRKRKEFEDVLRRSRHSLGMWVKYAKWEASQKEFARARSVWERALDVDSRNVSLWLKYVEMEMKNRFVNHARNLYDRMVTILPRVDQFWYKFAYMEEMLGNIANARQVFERWMQWEPDHQAWNTYLKMEIRHKEFDKARAVYERYCHIHHEVSTYLKYAKFEQRYGTKESSRAIYERALVELGDDAHDEELLLTFAKFEEEAKEYERARAIYRYALDHLPKHRAEKLYQTYTQFEKQHGDRNAVEDVVLSRRRFQYEEELKENAHNYDVWFDYIRLEEGRGEQGKIREVFERAIGNVPPIAEKRMWERYIYLWINFAIYEELVAKDVERARQVYAKCLEIIPHKQFTFSRLWIMAANLEVRCKQLEAARKILGTAIGLCPREKIFKAYIELEHKLGFVDRCRKLYEKYLEFMPANCAAWAKFAELEASLDEVERGRAIFELAIRQPQLDMPEVLWKAYIDFEIKGQRYDKVRALYGRLLERTKHVKVWISRAQFEASVRDVDRARAVFEDADKFFKGQDTRKEERVMLLESWLDFEKSFGTGDSLKQVANKLPRRIKKRRELKAEDGSHLGYEEYYDYIFPDEATKASNLKLLEMARKWKKQKTGDDGEAAAS